MSAAVTVTRQTNDGTIVRPSATSADNRDIDERSGPAGDLGRCWTAVEWVEEGNTGRTPSWNHRPTHETALRHGAGEIAVGAK